MHSFRLSLIACGLLAAVFTRAADANPFLELKSPLEPTAEMLKPRTT